MDLDRLNKALATFDTASYLFSLDNGATLQKCLEIADAANAYDDQIEAGVRKVIGNPEDNEDKPTIRNALKNTPNSRTKPSIILGKNKSRITDNRNPIVGSGLRNTAGQSIIKNSMKENSMNNQNSNGELSWIDGSQRNKIRIVKNAVLKSVANRKACQEEFDTRRYSLSPVVENMLRKKANDSAALKEAAGNNTVAAKSITGHGTPSERSVSDMLPPSWKNSGKDHALPVGREYDTASMMPSEFRPKIEASVDRSFGALAKRTAAAKTLDRPKPTFADQSQNDQGDKPYNQTSAKPPENGNPKDDRSMGAQTYKKHPNQEPQQWPEEPTGDTGSNQESGRGYY